MDVTILVFPLWVQEYCTAVTFACSGPGLSHIHPRKWINTTTQHLPFSSCRTSSVNNINSSEERINNCSFMVLSSNCKKLLLASLGCNEKTLRGL